MIDTRYVEADTNKGNVLGTKYETIDADQIDDIMAGATPREPKGWSDDDNSSSSIKKENPIKGPAEEL